MHGRFSASTWMWLRTYRLQNLHDLPEEVTQNKVIDGRIFSYICEVESDNQISNLDTIERFCKSPILNGTHEYFFVLVLETLKKRELSLKKVQFWS